MTTFFYRAKKYNGHVVHLVNTAHNDDPQAPAVCGTRPGITTKGWKPTFRVHFVETEITCNSCRNRKRRHDLRRAKKQIRTVEEYNNAKFDRRG